MKNRRTCNFSRCLYQAIFEHFTFIHH